MWKTVKATQSFLREDIDWQFCQQLYVRINLWKCGKDANCNTGNCRKLL